MWDWISSQSMPREEKGHQAKGEHSMNKDFCRATFYNLGLSGNRTTARRAPSADSRRGWMENDQLESYREAIRMDGS